MEEQRQAVKALLAHLAEKLEMKDAEPYEIAWKVSVTMYKQFTQSRNEEEIDMAVSFARMALFYDYYK